MRIQSGARQTMERLEASVLLSHLDEERTLSEIAAGLGISVSTLIRKLSRYHLPRRYRRSDREDGT